MEFDFLVDHARRNVWCTPNQDSQGIFKLTRLTPKKGVSIYTDVMWRRIYMPQLTTDPTGGNPPLTSPDPNAVPYNSNNDTKWHIFQIGQVSPAVLALVPTAWDWKSFADAMTEGKLVCDIYTTDGICLPRFETYYMFTPDHDLIVAVRSNESIPFDFENADYYLRIYANEYYHSLRSSQTNDLVVCEGKRLLSLADYTALKARYEYFKSLPGTTTAFVNGYIVSAINQGTVNMTFPQVGPINVVEFIYDSSIYRVRTFKVRDLPVFHSELDNKLKYLLHYSDPQSTDLIDYQDDIDVYIYRKTGDFIQGNNPPVPIRKGVLYHKNTKDAMRNLTHRDYSISVQYFNSLLGKLPQLKPTEPLDPQELEVEIFIRKSGYDRPLVYEDNRIHELYKLPMTPGNDLVKAALVDIDSVMPYWRAPHLEKAAYPLVMRSECCDIDNPMVTDAYGYNAISSLIGNTPSATSYASGSMVARIPYGLQQSCGVYEYNASGHLISGPHYVQGNELYSATTLQCTQIEVLSGRPSTTLDDYVLYEIGITDPLPIPANTSYRVYNCSHVAGIPTPGTLVDVTDSDKYVIDSSNRLVWVSASASDYPIVRMDKRFLSYAVNVNIGSGILQVNLSHYQMQNGNMVLKPMLIPMAQLDLFLNGRPLIEGLDYVMHFPRVVITNKEYLVDPETPGSLQRVDVRFSGLCKSDLTSEYNDDYGFIEHGVLSNNNRFDIRDDQVLRIIVDGSLKTRSDLIFSEMHSGISIVNALNGKPYAIRDIIVPVKGLATGDTYYLRTHSQVIDQAAGDYLTSKIPQPDRSGPSAIAARYQVISPFFNKIIADFINGVISIYSQPWLYGPYTDQQLIDHCRTHYEWLLAYDPINEANDLPDQYVIVHPHNRFTTVSVDAYAYKFLRKAAAIYGRGLIELSPHLTITPTPPIP